MVTAIGLTVTPLLAMLGRVAGRYLSHREIIPTIDLPSEPKAAVILGFGRVGHMVAQMLDVHGRPYRAIDADPERVAVAREQGFKVIYGDVSRQQVLDRLVDIDPAGTVILTMDDPVQNVRLTEKLRARYPDLTIISRARDARHAAELYRAGASDAVPETLESSLQLSEAVLVDLGVAMGPVIASIHEKRAALRDEIKAHGETLREPPIHRRRLREAKDELNAG
jgi:CPA2 family monovalent cation:H+ antiporter-2